MLVWKDGSRMIWDDGNSAKDYEEMLESPDLEDMFHDSYPKDTVIFQKNYDKSYKSGRKTTQSEVYLLPIILSIFRVMTI